MQLGQNFLDLIAVKGVSMEQKTRQNSAAAQVVAVQTNLPWGQEIVYREMDEQPVQALDLLADLQKNLSALNQLQQRTRFLLAEIQPFVRTRN